LEELPNVARAIVVIKTATAQAKIALLHHCHLEAHWVSEIDSCTSRMGLLEEAVRSISLPEGEGYVWAAGEYSDIKAVRQYLADELGIDKSRIRAASYWRKLASNTHEYFD
jgi:NADPH-dependent ferric siderophore reductase